MSIYTRMVLDSPVLRRAFEVEHLDTADRRGLANMGRLEPGNVGLALRHASRLLGLLLRRRAELVYVQVSQNRWAYVRDALFMAIARALGARVVTHLHGSAFREFYESESTWVRWLVRRSSAWVSAAGVLSPAFRPLYEGLVPARRIHVAGVGVPDPFPAGPPERSSRVLPVVIGYLGALHRPKGILDLLEAAALMKAESREFRLLLAGPWLSSAEREAIEGTVTRLGLGDRVRLPGPVEGDRKRAFLAELDIFVFPGRQREGMPLVLAEALAAGLPIVTTDVGAATEAVVDGQTGLVVPPRQPTALARALSELEDRADARRSMGAAGRSRYLARFTEERAVEALAMLLRRGMEGYEGRQGARGRG